MVHVQTKRSLELADQNVLTSPSVIAPPLLGPHMQLPVRTSLSLSLTPKITAARENLSSVLVVTILSGYVTDAALEDVLPSVINCSLAGPLTPVNDNTYLAPLSYRADVKEASKLDVTNFSTKDGVCSVKFAPWSAELGSLERADGDGVWVCI